MIRHLNRKENSLRLTHLVFCNAGTNGDFGGDEARMLFHNRISLLEAVAHENNLSLLCVDTNINEFLKQKQEPTCTFRTLSTPLAFQKLFRYYYYGSTYPFKDFHFQYSDPSSYDLLNMMCLSTENISFYSSGGETTRMGKLREISENGYAQKYLNVCVRTLYNCGDCLKCRRTMLDLYALDKLDKFREVFPVDKFYKNVDDYLVYLVRFRNTIDMYEVYESLKKQGKISLKHYLIACFYNIGHAMKILIRKQNNGK